MKKERMIGNAEKRRYDLPIGKSPDTGFLTTLIGLMTFLAILAVSSAFAMSSMAGRWTSGLENRMTIEIPAQGPDGTLMNRDKITLITKDIADSVGLEPGIRSIEILDESQINTLIEPWLGQGVIGSDFPVPGIISIETDQTTTQLIQNIHNRVKAVSSEARIDTHEQWLGDLLRFTKTLQVAACVLVIVIGMAAVTAVTGTVRTRMALNRPEIELLHLMGARDSYICRQFQRHSLIISLSGAALGAAAAAITLLSIAFILAKMEIVSLPANDRNGLHICVLSAIPLIAGLIAVVTTRMAVLRDLESFP